VQLDELLKGAACALKDTVNPDRSISLPVAAPPPPERSLLISAETPAGGVAAGSTAEVVITLKNATEGWLVLDLGVSCGAEMAFSTTALDASGKRADRLDLGCDRQPWCRSAVARIALEAGGVARKTVRFDTHVSRVEKSCKVTPAGTLRPGTYTLEVDTPLFDRDPHDADRWRSRVTRAPLVVR
jgi:hypothetical protein